MKIQRRMAFHFTYQLIVYSILVFISMTILFLVLINKITNEELKRNLPVAALDSVISETYYQNDTLKFPSYWSKFIKEKNMWLQVLGSKGDVIYEVNTDSDQPTAYSVTQLLTLQETGKYNHYFVNMKLDNSYESPLLFLLGFENPRQEQLALWYDSYQENGIVAEGYKETLLKELQETNSYLTIVNLEGESIQTIGKPSSSMDSYEPLEILSMKQAPGNFDTNVVVYQSDKNAMTWIVHTPNQPGSFNDQPILKEFINIFIWVGGSILVLSLAISIWHGYRYAQPLILFTGWFERMGKGLYAEVLTPKDRRRVFRKNGKLRIRYRLYREVIQSFYQMAEQLAQTEKDRFQLEKTREEWMSGISHDLRTPLSTIQGYGYILESSPAVWSQEELQEMGKMIREKGDYMLDLITDFSHIYQLKQGAIFMDQHDIELGELTRRSVLKYVNDVTLANVEFQYEGDDQSVPVIGNEKWLQRLMDNLLSNAVKHNSSGVTITVVCGMLNDEAFIQVSDNGRGMDEETMGKLFERYYRGTNTEETTAGSGLGMSIAKMIVEAHLGRIEIRSTIGRGTTIFVYLPTK
ncbi:sensor histidine kinase [Paenibacillus glacialis]|uniref:histidine kinase n=1 Tax=Paenibacillus glacialis TaxID=494026 RepID=A0A168N6Z0_9BACL|nr:HAMP domain-containing sensor histidine kinase [Paenibacillus glacialis]OAB45465.1 two-component sensor histidine kinase [Paenibacillus glacialis]